MIDDSMIKEKLGKEAEELIQRFEIANSMNNFLQLTPDRKQIGEMLVMFAEPREKRIAELEAQIKKMECDLLELRHDSYDAGMYLKIDELIQKWGIKEND